MKEGIEINCSKDEALVLFDFLSRFNQATNASFFEDQAEQRVLGNIETQLEKILVEPFEPDYINIIKQARNRIRDGQ